MSDVPIVVEHDDFIVVNKPINIGMHAPETTILEQFKNTAYQSLSLVHRLDTPTSGCLILAKNKAANAKLCKLFETHQINKYYIALVSKTPKKKQGRVVGNMKKSRNGSYMLSKSTIPNTATLFKSVSLKKQTDTGQSNKLIYLKPISGKTHQLRVCMKSLGAPIIGDQRYGGDASDRMYLHCYGMDFVYNEQSISARAFPQQGRLFSKQTLAKIGDIDDYVWPSFSLPDGNFQSTQTRTQI